MFKMFCDWCGKEIDKHGNAYNSTELDFPSLVVPYEDGKPCGDIDFNWECPRKNRYDVCLDCVRKIWRLRHDQA
jgi:hypothetical protein